MNNVPKAEATWLESVEQLGVNNTYPTDWIWQPFLFSSPLARLTALVKQWLPSQNLGHGPFNDLLDKLPADWPKGRSNLYERVEQDYFRASAMAIYKSDGSEGLTTVIPSLQRLDVRHPLTIRRVYLWPDKLQASVGATYGDLEISFYDTGWMLHFHRYVAGHPMEFSLVGLAHSARACESQIRELIEPSWLQERLDSDADFPFEVNSMGQRVVKVGNGRSEGLCSTIEGPDTFDFCGKVKQLKALPNLFGQPAWLVLVTVERDRESLGNLVGELDLDIVITQCVWGDKPPPALGEDIEGEIWLQGCVTGL